MTTKKKIVFVVNPISGTQGKRAILKWIDERINRTLYDYTIVKTQYAGHAEKIAATAAKEKVDIVVAIGGDGTINEIGRALIHTDTALGIIPCGSGNGLARHLQIPLEPKAAIDIINESSVACIDYGKINNIPFFCTCGVGFDAFVSLKFADSGKRGLLTYLENTLHESLSYKPETYEIENETEDDNGNIFKVASIKIYKDDENGPRYSTEIPLSSLGSGDSLEVGMVIAWTLATNPSDNYLECNGQSIDSTKYPKLYELMHNVPDYRGMFLRGLGGNSADLGELQNYALIEHTHEITMPASHGKSGNGGIPRFSDGDVWSNNKTKLTTGITDDIPIANEVRPINKAVRYFIKAK